MSGPEPLYTVYAYRTDVHGTDAAANTLECHAYGPFDDPNVSGALAEKLVAEPPAEQDSTRQAMVLPLEAPPGG